MQTYEITLMDRTPGLERPRASEERHTLKAPSLEAAAREARHKWGPNTVVAVTLAPPK